MLESRQVPDPEDQTVQPRQPPPPRRQLDPLLMRQFAYDVEDPNLPPPPPGALAPRSADVAAAPPEGPGADAAAAPPEGPEADGAAAPPEDPGADGAAAPLEDPEADVAAAPPEDPGADAAAAPPEDPEADGAAAPPEDPEADAAAALLEEDEFEADFVADSSAMKHAIRKEEVRSGANHGAFTVRLGTRCEKSGEKRRIMCATADRKLAVLCTSL